MVNPTKLVHGYNYYPPYRLIEVPPFSVYGYEIIEFFYYGKRLDYDYSFITRVFYAHGDISLSFMFVIIGTENMTIEYLKTIL